MSDVHSDVCREYEIRVAQFITFVCVSFFFFFKQKTAYEIYQCDWSSDVCSSDLDFYPLDTNDIISPADKKEITDYVKITTLKFYSITGKSHQRQGVQPHITLPDILTHFDFTESDRKSVV